jgi:hypothetical protein
VLSQEVGVVVNETPFYYYQLISRKCCVKCASVLNPAFPGVGSISITFKTGCISSHGSAY